MAAALIQSLTWKPLYATDVALKSQKTSKQKAIYGCHGTADKKNDLEFFNQTRVWALNFFFFFFFLAALTTWDLGQELNPAP